MNDQPDPRGDHGTDAAMDAADAAIDAADTTRSLEFEIEVAGSPEEVWTAIATGPGISSWYVPHTVEEREGGAATARFGPGDGMEIPGRVAAWEPPHRIVFAGADDTPGAEASLAFEWLIEARSGGTCVVRLVNTGFGTSAEWDAQYDGMAEGWLLFLRNLQLHLEHFGGRTATPSLPVAATTLPIDDAWSTLLTAFGLTVPVELDERVELRADHTLTLAGRVVDVAPRRLALLVDTPAEGTAFLAAEAMGEHAGLSVWSYLYGPEGHAAATRDEPRWLAWLAQLFE